MKKPILTKENYYDDNFYMSTSRFKNYITCESRAVAIDNGAWEDKSKPIALTVGNYIHSYFEGFEAHETFVQQYEKRIFKSNGDKCADFIQADKCIDTLENDFYFMRKYNGEFGDNVQKELIVTGNLEGLDFKGRIDSTNLTRSYFVDLKTMRSIRSNDIFSPMLHRRVPQIVYNVYEYYYHLQMYIYQQLVQQEYGCFTPYIAAVSKEEIPDKEFVLMDETVLANGKQIFESHVERVKQVLLGIAEPKKCGMCDWCRHTKEITRPVTLSEIVTGDK